MGGFSTRCRQLLGERHGSVGAELDAALEQVRAAAGEAWPAWPTSDERFAARLVDLIGEDAAPVATLEKLHAADVYLALGCADGQRDALAALERQLLPDLRGTLGRMGLPASSIDETLQVMREELLVPRAEGPPRILGYVGRGPLRGWLRSIAARTGLREVKHPHRNVELDEQLHAAPSEDLEMDYLRRTYGEAFRAAFRAALAQLDTDARVLLKQRFRHRMTVEDLGELHGVHAGTISRRVAAARGQLVELTKAAMMVEIGSSRDEVSSILRLIQSQMEISLSELS